MTAEGGCVTLHSPLLPLSPHNHHQTRFISFGCGHGDAGRGGGDYLVQLFQLSHHRLCTSQLFLAERSGTGSGENNTVCGRGEVWFQRSVFTSCQLMASPRWCAAIWTNTNPPPLCSSAAFANMFVAIILPVRQFKVAFLQREGGIR